VGRSTGARPRAVPRHHVLKYRATLPDRPSSLAATLRSVTGQAAPFGIASDASHIYWTNSGDGTIWRANLDGTNAQSIVLGEGQNSLFAVAGDANHLYWTNRSQGMVKRANLDGTNPRPSSSARTNRRQ
jgi:sugar lactone lactonase YvrE